MKRCLLKVRDRGKLPHRQRKTGKGALTKRPIRKHTQTDGQTDIKTEENTYKTICKHTNRHRETDREADTGTDKTTFTYGD